MDYVTPGELTWFGEITAEWTHIGDVYGKGRKRTERRVEWKENWRKKRKMKGERSLMSEGRKDEDEWKE